MFKFFRSLNYTFSFKQRKSSYYYSKIISRLEHHKNIPINLSNTPKENLAYFGVSEILEISNFMSAYEKSIYSNMEIPLPRIIELYQKAIVAINQ